MLGLIKKDLLMIKGNAKFFILYLIVFAFISEGSNEILYFVPVFLITMIFMSTFSYDDYNKWNAYACTLPCGKRNVVKAKYLASIALTIIAIIATYILGISLGLFNNNLDFIKLNLMINGVLFAMIFFQSLMYPLLFKFGAEKSRIVLFVGFFLMGTLLGIILKGITIEIPENIIILFAKYWYLILPLIMILVLFISYNISKRIYLKKEF